MRRAGAGRYWLIWPAVIAVLGWAVVRAFGLERGFPAIPLIAYTPYVAAAALLLSGVAVALRNWPAALACGLATASLLLAVLPRAFSGEIASAPADRQLRVYSVNIHLGGADPTALVARVRRFRPDFLNLQELTPGFAHQLEEAGIRRLLPHAVFSLRLGLSGGGIYSRFPLRRLPTAGHFPLRMPRAAMRLPDGHTIRIVDVHPQTPKRRLVSRWIEGLRDLPSAGRGAPWVLAGDFNATLDHAELRDVIARGYRDAGAVTGRGLEATWPAGRLLPPPVTIDHVLADRRLGIVDYGVEGLPGSDHRAIHAVLALPWPHALNR
ncbi:MAG TPA: endonuclease/exonuclease/phosphatase family protein [Solirubrobacterales bacterium]|nr:endonuclease/exonuclease/phosphatase family protein [Solirubrobacterales bacterium]